METDFRIAFLTCASYRVNREAVAAVAREASSQVLGLSRDLGLELAHGSSVVTRDDELDAVLAEIGQPAPDVLILHYAGWTEDSTVLKIVDAFRCPVMLWVTGDVFVDGVSLLVAHVGYMEADSFLKKMQRRFSRYYGGPDAESAAELRAFLTAAKALAELRRIKFGWIGEGYGSEGILDGTFDEAALAKKLGVQFVRIGLEEIFDRYERTRITEDPTQARELRRFGVDLARLRERLSDDVRAVDDSVRFLLAMSDTVAEHELGALSLRCFPEFKENDVPAPCLTISAMNQSGTTASCEGDVLSGVSMFILSRLSGCPATMTDVLAYDEDHNTMELFHCGGAAPALADPNTPVDYHTHCKPRNHRAGVTVEFPVRPGKVSFFKVDMLGDQCKLFLYQGEAIAPARKVRGNQAVIRTFSPVKALIETLLDHGASHHQVLSVGDVSREAEFVAELASLDLVRL